MRPCWAQPASDIVRNVGQNARVIWRVNPVAKLRSAGPDAYFPKGIEARKVLSLGLGIPSGDTGSPDDNINGPDVCFDWNPKAEPEEMVRETAITKMRAAIKAVMKKILKPKKSKCNDETGARKSKYEISCGSRSQAI